MKLRALIALAGISLSALAPLSVSAQRSTRAYQTVNPGLVARAQQVTGDRFSVAMTTPRGVAVIARATPRPELLNAIDQGFAELFAIAQRHGYRNHLSFSDYTVFIGRADRTRNSSGQYSPDIAVGASQYAGSVYDQGGYVFAAGMVLTFAPSSFVIAEHERDLARVSNVVRYEGEHIILYYNDRRLYAETADHSQGGSHPILQ
jgi:hypothetical protein